MAPLCYSSVEVHRSVGSLVQGRLGVVYQQEKSCFFPEGTTMWLEMENSGATGGLLAGGAVGWLPCAKAMWRWSCTGV